MPAPEVSTETQIENEAPLIPAEVFLQRLNIDDIIAKQREIYALQFDSEEYHFCQLGPCFLEKYRKAFTHGLRSIARALGLDPIANNYKLGELIDLVKTQVENGEVLADILWTVLRMLDEEKSQAAWKARDDSGNSCINGVDSLHKAKAENPELFEVTHIAQTSDGCYGDPEAFVLQCVEWLAARDPLPTCLHMVNIRKTAAQIRENKDAILLSPCPAGEEIWKTDRIAQRVANTLGRITRPESEKGHPITHLPLV